MKIFGRGDRILVAGLVVAVLVLFAGRAAEAPISALNSFTRQVELQSGLALVPALLILTIVFFIHQQGKRREAKALASAAAVDAVQAQAHSAELERLVAFGQALSRSLDIDAIRDSIVQHLPGLAGTDGAWVMARAADGWQMLADASTPETTRRDRERIADRAVDASGRLRTDPLSVDGHLCLPLAAGGDSIGVLGVPEAAVTMDDGRRRVLAAATALLGVSIKNAQLFNQVRESSVRDGLTGCFNRTHAVEVIVTELRRMHRSQMPLSLIMFDLDHFKAINDEHGHLCGDAVLAAVGVRMRAVLRASDLKCRYGGEEFLVLLPDTPLEGAMRVADSLRRDLAEMPVVWQQETIRITASFGVTSARPSESGAETIIGRADQALYRAKDQGRNCVRLLIESAVA